MRKLMAADVCLSSMPLSDPLRYSMPASREGRGVALREPGGSGIRHQGIPRKEGGQRA